MNTTSIVHALLSHEATMCEDTEAEMVVLGLATDEPAALRRVVQRLARCGENLRVAPGYAREVTLKPVPDDTRIVSVSVSAAGCEMSFALNDQVTLHIRQSGDDMYAWVS